MKECSALVLAATLAASALAGRDSGSSSTDIKASETETEEAKAAEDTAAAGESGISKKEPDSVNLSIMLALGQRTDDFDSVIEGYKKDNPQVGTVEYEFPNSSTCWDLLEGYLLAGTMPDIFGYGFGEQIESRHGCLAGLSDLESAKSLSAEQMAMCSVDGKTIQVMPMVMEGWGILYNIRHLNQVGWEKPPETISELEKLCKDLKAAGIQPFIHHYTETSLSLTNHLDSTWITAKKDPLGYFEELKSGKGTNLTENPGLDVMLDYYDLALQYGNDDAITTDKRTGRDAFFLEEAAMIDGEGSREVPNIMDVSPGLADHVVQGRIPITDDASKGKLQTASICAAVYKDSPQLDEAKKFLNYLVKGNYTVYWRQDVMGSIPGLSTILVSGSLARLRQDVFTLMRDGLTHETMTPWRPDEVKDSISEVWSLYVGKQTGRPQLFKQYQEIWTNCAANK